jgi:hypothetical protein
MSDESMIVVNKPWPCHQQQLSQENYCSTENIQWNEYMFYVRQDKSLLHKDKVNSIGRSLNNALPF